VKVGEAPIHPVLFAVHPVLALHASNVALVPVADLWAPIGAVTLGSFVAGCLFSLVFRNLQRGARVASAFAVSFFLFGTVQEVFAQSARRAAGPEMSTVYATWGAGALVLLVLAGWKWKEGQRLNTVLNLAGALMCGFAVFQIANAYVSTASRVSRALDRRAMGAEVSGSRSPDVFYIVLDGYGRDDVLRRDFGATWSLSDQLTERGFFVARESRANYVQTQLSIASSLNLDLVQRLVTSTGTADHDRLSMDRLIDDSYAARTLRSTGYQTIAITTGFPALTFNSANLWITDDKGRSLFVDALVYKTPIRRSQRALEGQFEVRRRQLVGAFSDLKRLAKRGSSPRFVIVHVLAPHPPFVFGPNGEPRRPDSPYVLSDGSHFIENVGSAEEYRAGYRDQAEYIGKLTIDAIDALLAESRDAVVIVQGDHGPKSGLDQESAANTDMGEVLPILNAYYVPDKVRNELYDEITPVNSFRALFRGLFAMDLPQVDDKSYYSPWSAPLDFVEVPR
jgi:hypothetical protein